MNIGANKPSVADQLEARHHLIDIALPEENLRYFIQFLMYI
jgi:tRNA A37 N6-isopentenylltransferase MiaA